MRKIVIVSDRLAYLGDVPVADYRDRSSLQAHELMEQFAAKYRAGGWMVVDMRELVPAA